MAQGGLACTARKLVPSSVSFSQFFAMSMTCCSQSGSASFSASISLGGLYGRMTLPHDSGMGCAGSLRMFGSLGSITFFLRMSIWLSLLYAVIMCDFWGLGALGSRGTLGPPTRLFFFAAPRISLQNSSAPPSLSLS